MVFGAALFIFIYSAVQIMLTMKTVLGPLTLRTTHNTDHTFWMTYIWSCATFSRISEYTGTRLCLKRFSDYEMNLIVYRHGSWSV